VAAPDDTRTPTLLDTWGTEPQMNALETAMWHGERHPANSSQGVFIQLLDTTPDWERLVDDHRRVVELLPRLRQRVVSPLIPSGPPVWALDAGFDIAYHLRRIRLPDAGTRGQLMEYAQTQASTPLDRGRPLWTASLVEGMEGGRAAYVFVVHHCLTDGMGVIQLLSTLQSRERRGAALERGPVAGAAAPVAGALALTGRQLTRAAVRAPLRGVGVFARIGRSVVTQPGASLRYAGSLRRMTAPPKATPSPLMNAGCRRSWRFGTMECELSALKAAAKAAGGSLNDAYVSAILGGLRRYHEAMGVAMPDIPMSMPVSVRRSDDTPGGNRFAGAFFAAPSSVADPVERMQLLGETVRRIQGEPALDFFSLVLPVLNLAPSPILAAAFTSLQSQADLTLSNVPGIPHRVTMAGAGVERMFCYGPLPGSAMTCVLCTHNGVCCIGINCDAEAFTDTPLLFELMHDALDEVLALA
jgi:diacylglycerol O-acyltransferase